MLAIVHAGWARSVVAFDQLPNPVERVAGDHRAAYHVPKCMTCVGGRRPRPRDGEARSTAGYPMAIAPMGKYGSGMPNAWRKGGIAWLVGPREK
jgi:hypothetical protein